jgi:hypothetical protein
MQDLSLIRSMLFSPADRPVLDLEDGVGLPAKQYDRRGTDQ